MSKNVENSQDVQSWQDGVLSVLEDRIRDPFIGTFLISVTIFSWRGLYVLVRPGDLEVSATIDAAAKYFSWANGFCALLLAALYTFAYPHFRNWVAELHEGWRIQHLNRQGIKLKKLNIPAEVWNADEAKLLNQLQVAKQELENSTNEKKSCLDSILKDLLPGIDSKEATNRFK